MSGDLVIRGGRVIDPAQGVDRVADLVVSGGRVSGLDMDAPQGAEVVDATRAPSSPPA